MPLFPPRNTPVKKTEIFNYKVFEFLRFLEKNANEEKLLVLSSKVKIAKINLLKAKLALLKTYKEEEDNNPTSLKVKNKLQREISKWKSISFEEIKVYCKSL